MQEKKLKMFDVLMGSPTRTAIINNFENEVKKSNMYEIRSIIHNDDYIEDERRLLLMDIFIYQLVDQWTISDSHYLLINNKKFKIIKKTYSHDDIIAYKCKKNNCDYDIIIFLSIKNFKKS